MCIICFGYLLVLFSSEIVASRDENSLYFFQSISIVYMTQFLLIGLNEISEGLNILRF